MTIKDIYRVILRLIGVFFFIRYVMGNLAAAMYSTYNSYDVNSIISSAISFAMVLVISHILVFRTDIIIKFLHLDEGHDSHQIATSDLSSHKLFKLVFVFTGVLLATDYAVTFVMQIYYFFAENISNKVPIASNFRLQEFMYSFISILFGLFISLNAAKLAVWFGKKDEPRQ